MMMNRVDAVKGCGGNSNGEWGISRPLPVYDWVLFLSNFVKCERAIVNYENTHTVSPQKGRQNFLKLE